MAPNNERDPTSTRPAMVIDRNCVASAKHYSQILDALYRFGAGVDTNDPGLLNTVFCDDAVIDFGPCGRKIGLAFPLLTGAGTIVRFLSASADSQTTSHVITNGRIHIEGEGAGLRALVDATHLPRNDRSRRFQMMNWYDVDLLRVDHLWRIRHLTIDNVWFAGDPQVLLGK